MTSFDFTRKECSQLQELVASTGQTRVFRRAQALLWLGEGDRPNEVAERSQVSRQTLYNGTARFLQREGLDIQARLEDGPRSGRPPTAHGIIDPLLEQVIDGDPQDWGYHSTVWTAPLLQQYLDDLQDIQVSCQSVRAALHRLDLRWKRPRHNLTRQPDTWRQAKGG